jgi:DNA-binding response OmpR family regulator
MIVKESLESREFIVFHAENGEEALEMYQTEKPDILVLDVMMPKKDGFTLAKDIRKTDKKIPILFLTAKASDEDKIAGFKAGGDDYLTKPFNVEELQLRVAAMLRRIDIESEIKEKSTYQIGGYNFDVINYTLVHENFNKNLTKKEAQILSFLCKFMNNVVPRDIILNGVWGQDDYFVGRSLDVFITKLRKYLSEDETIQLVNVHGIGFKLEVQD